MESYRYSDDDIQEEDIQMEEENDRRLRQAINYLKNHGGPDSFELYRDRVNRINDLIINRYVDEGRLFDVDMYRELRRMVDSQLEAFNRSTENVIEVSSDESLDSLSSGDPDVQMSGALYRDDADDPATPERSPRRRASLTPSPPPAPRPRSRFWKASGKDLGPPLPRPSFREEPPTAEIGSIQWRYGGPRNTAEDWKRNFPPILPFGESLSIREMESRQINYDLAMGPFATPEQAMAKRPDMYENPNKEGSYDTGARFKLLRNTETRREVERVLGDGMSFLRSVVREFNDAGGKGIQVKKDYAPRVFLETVHVPRRNAPRRPSTGLGPSPAGSGRRSSAPTAPATSQAPRPASAGPSRPRSAPVGLSSQGAPSTRNTPRRASLQRTVTPGSPPRRVVVRPFPPPTSGRAKGRPKKYTAPASPTPATRRKRTLAEADDSYDEARSSASKRGRAGKRVAFEEPSTESVKKPGYRRSSGSSTLRSGLKFKR